MNHDSLAAKPVEVRSSEGLGVIGLPLAKRQVDTSILRSEPAGEHDGKAWS